MNIRTRLVLLDSLCNANSEEAVSVLKDISKDPQSFSKQDKWFYRLLCVKVADKFTDGNISRHEVSKILSYYESSWCDAGELSSAYYYMGRCYFSENNMPMALHYYRQCISNLSDEKCRLSGNVNFQTGYLFLEQGFPNYALPYFRKSLEIEQALNDTAMAVYCLQKIAYSYQDMKSDSCLLYFERALRLADRTRQDWLINEIKNSLATHYLQKGSYGKAKELALPVLRTMEDENPGKNSFYSVVGLSCYGMGQIDSARYYFHKLFDLGDVESKTVASKYLYRIYAKSGDTAKALHYLDEYDQNDDSLKTIKVEASVARMNALFNYTMYKERNEYLEASRMRMIFISVVALLLVALLLVCIYVRMRMLKQRSEPSLEPATIQDRNRRAKERACRAQRCRNHGTKVQTSESGKQRQYGRRINVA